MDESVSRGVFLAVVDVGAGPSVGVLEPGMPFNIELPSDDYIFRAAVPLNRPMTRDGSGMWTGSTTTQVLLVYEKSEAHTQEEIARILAPIQARLNKGNS